MWLISRGPLVDKQLAWSLDQSQIPPSCQHHWSGLPLFGRLKTHFQPNLQPNPILPIWPKRQYITLVSASEPHQPEPISSLISAKPILLYSLWHGEKDNTVSIWRFSWRSQFEGLTLPILNAHVCMCIQIRKLRAYIWATHVAPQSLNNQKQWHCSKNW